jgi:hypothetical protein
LRALRSNPEAPPARAKKSRTSRQKKVSQELSVLSLLRGVIDKPKVALYRRRQQIAALKKTADSMTCINEENDLLALAAADQLNPSEITRLPDVDLCSALEQLLQRIPASELPKETVLGLCRRMALMSIDSPQDFAFTVWPWACRAEDIPVDFDPFDPRLSEAPSSSDLTLAQKVTWAVDFIIKDAVATLMSNRTEKASLSLVELARVITDLAASQAVQDDLNKDIGSMKQIKELIMTLIGLAAVAQTSPVSSDQLQALISIRDGKVSAAAPLQPLICDPWWADRLRRVWATAAKESLAAPAMEEILTALKSSDACHDRVMAAWEGK